MEKARQKQKNQEVEEEDRLTCDCTCDVSVLEGRTYSRDLVERHESAHKRGFVFTTYS